MDQGLNSHLLFFQQKDAIWRQSTDPQNHKRNTIITKSFVSPVPIVRPIVVESMDNRFIEAVNLEPCPSSLTTDRPRLPPTDNTAIWRGAFPWRKESDLWTWSTICPNRDTEHRLGRNCLDGSSVVLNRLPLHKIRCHKFTIAWLCEFIMFNTIKSICPLTFAQIVAQEISLLPILHRPARHPPNKTI